MNKQCALISVAVLMALLVVGAGAVAKQPPAGEGPLMAMDVSVGEPGTVFRYAGTFGVTEQAYIADTTHLNRPDGLFIDGSDNLYVVEELGSRMLKYRTSDSANLMSIGTAGLQNRAEYSFDHPQDVTVDSGGNIWVVDRHRAAQYDASGNFLQELPSDDPWNSGSDNTHFDTPRSIAFDSDGRLYVSDTENHRIQVYTVTVAGSIVHSTTIGVTDVSGSDNAHFDRPAQVVIDGSDHLYVADLNNFRVQRCTYVAGWTCTTFHGTGSDGSGSNELSWAYGLGIDGSDNIYIADGNNARVKKCDSGGSCSTFATGFDWPADVAVDSSGDVYVSDWSECTIREYNSNGVFQGRFAGASDVPYLTDDGHFNAPYGVAVDSSGNIIVTEEQGHRLLKLNSGGVAQWSVGQAGVIGSDNTHFGDLWDGSVAVAVDSSGNIYVADSGNHRVQKCTSAGVCSTFAGISGVSGSDNTHFDLPYGVVVDSSGNVYVSDRDNHRVQKCTPAGVCSTFAGVTGVSGSDDSHFNAPMGVAVDSSGNVYVGDGWNNRVQKCTSDGSCSTFAGTTGAWDDDFDHFWQPRDIAVDSQDQVYVADIYNNRVQVFDSSGAYLTTIGGEWGSNIGQMRHTAAVDVDSAGNVYVTDSINHRIQKFAPGVPGWKQVNINGFGDQRNSGIWTLARFDGQLYAGTYNPDTGAQLWRTGNSWTAVFTDGFGSAYNVGIDHLVEFKGDLYAGTCNETDSGSNGGQIWRSDTGNPGDWQMVASGGFTSTNNSEAFRFAVFNNQLYAATWNPTDGGELWRSSNGDNGTWAPVVTGGFGDADNKVFVSLAEFNSYLYAGTDNQSGAEVWRSSSGDSGSWTRVVAGGFGDSYNWSITLEPFNGYLYAGTYNYKDSDNPGHELWRCQQCDGTDWEQVPIAKGFGDTENRAIRSLIVFDNVLYALTYNRTTGMEVWRTTDGTNWEQVGPDGLGDSNNYEVGWDSAVAVFNDSLYIGTKNWANGGEVWQLLHQVFLPLVLRNH